jgi:hypothetical protein
MEKILKILLSASAGYYAQKALATKSDAANIGIAIMVTASINQLLNEK